MLHLKCPFGEISRILLVELVDSFKTSGTLRICGEVMLEGGESSPVADEVVVSGQSFIINEFGIAFLSIVFVVPYNTVYCFLLNGCTFIKSVWKKCLLQTKTIPNQVCQNHKLKYII